MFSDDEQAARDAAVAAALEAYDGREPGRDPYPLWEALWAACDFSWEGLADAGWERGDGANFAQKLKRWDDGGTQRTLQDYWRRAARTSEDEDEQPTEKVLRERGLLVDVDGTPWFVLHRPNSNPFMDLDQPQVVLLRDILRGLVERMHRPQEPNGWVRLAGVRADDVVTEMTEAWQQPGQPLRIRAPLARLHGLANGIAIADRADFSRSVVMVDFSSCAFGSDVSFRGAILRDSTFEKSRFGDRADFFGIHGESTSHKGAEFGASARFDSAWLGSFDFEGASFGRDASFRGALSTGGGGFSKSRFQARANFQECRFPSQLVFDDSEFGDRADFAQSIFGDWSSFTRARFGDGASFRDCRFGYNMMFVETRFGRNAAFNGAVFCPGSSFRDCTFGEGADFGPKDDLPAASLIVQQAEVGHYDFEGATFGDGARLAGVSFPPRTRFAGARFGEGTDFHGARFGDGCDFGSAEFAPKASLAGAAFGDGVRMAGAQFGDGVSFGDGDQPGASFGTDADFRTARFGADVDFAGATFGNGARFDRAEFGPGADLRATYGAAWFDDCRFTGRLSASGARFTGPIRFEAAEFEGIAEFRGAAWPTAQTDHEGAFRGAWFRQVAEFGGPDFCAYALFAGVNFLGGLLVDDAEVGMKEETPLIRRAFRAAEEGGGGDAEKARRYDMLAKGLQTLKQAMAAQGDRDREQRFFRFEVQARARRPGEGPIAKAAAWLYGWTSGYGASVGRPLVWAFAVWVAFAGLYGLAGLVGGTLAWAESADGPVQALQLSLANSFRPFFLLEVPREGTPGFWAELLRRNDGLSLLVRLLGALQSLATVVLLFLAGVALRRKFQIG